MISLSGPAEVRGKLEKYRNAIQFVLLVFFLLAPWIKVKNEQMLLFDIFNRHFVFFGYTFFSHDAPILFFLLILVLLTLFLVTALYGRLWCGWSCPQTVFIHAVFNRIERLILGQHLGRNKFYKSEDSLAKKIKILFVYLVFFVVSWLIAHSFVAYFLGAPVVASYIYEGPTSHLKAFIVLNVMSLVLFFNFAFFREKLCFFVCPYGRFQNALIDQNSLVVSYDPVRGEPRGVIKKTLGASSDLGDCVDCQRCVRVCPTKIDIRNGFQLECISCGKCIDACNEIMTKVGRPTHLIRYESVDRKPIDYARFRIILYSGLITVFTVGFLWVLNSRSQLDLSITRNSSKPFISRVEGEKKILSNHFMIHIKNQTNVEMDIQMAIAEKYKIKGYSLVTPALSLKLQPEQDIKVTAFVELADSSFDVMDNNVVIELTSAGLKTPIIKTIKFIKGE